MKSKARILIPDPLRLAALPSLVAADRVIDTERSILKIYVGKSGLFPAAGHEHWLTTPFAKGSFNDGDFPPPFKGSATYTEDYRSARLTRPLSSRNCSSAGARLCAHDRNIW